MSENEISKIVYDLCLSIHRKYGPGLFESVYEEILCYELNKLNIILLVKKKFNWFMKKLKWMLVSEQM